MGALRGKDAPYGEFLEEAISNLQYTREEFSELPDAVEDGDDYDYREHLNDIHYCATQQIKYAVSAIRRQHEAEPGSVANELLVKATSAEKGT
jgi:hypothetical protein